MNNVSKTWVDPINMNASELNRIEQLIMNTHSNTAILNGEVSTLQNKYLQLSTTLNSLLGSQDTLKTLSELTKLASNNLDILDTLNNTTKLVKASSQEFTKEELTQIYDNLHLNSFLHLKDIRVNGESVIKGSIADIQIDTIINNTQSSSSSSPGSSNSSSDTGSIPSGGTISNKLSDMIQDDLHQTISQEDRDKWDLITKAVFNETDPTVPNWAKQESKPTYLYEEILNRPQKLSELTDDLNYATPSYVDTKVSDLQELLLGPGSTEAIDTIQELATEIQNNSEILDALNQAITNKAPKDHTHTESEITDLKEYSLKTHTHTKSQITDFTHTHGLLNSTFGSTIANTTTDSGWSMIDSSMSASGSHSGYLLKALFTGANAPTWAMGGNACGIAYGGSDVKGVIMSSYSIPQIRFSGGNGSKPVWNITLKGTSGNTYDLSTLASKTHTHDYLPLSGGTMTGPIVLNDGDGTTKGNIQLLANGQITDGSTATLLGRVSSVANALLVGHGNYTLQLRGKNTRPTYNGNDLALKSDVGSVDLSGYVTSAIAQREFGMLVPKGTAVPEKANLNTVTYLKVGSYYCSADATVATLTNCPTSSAFMMQVLSPLSPTYDNESAAWVYRVRILTTYTCNVYYQNCSTNGSGTWSYGTWRKVLNSGGGAIDSGCTLTINGTLVI